MKRAMDEPQPPNDPAARRRDALLILGLTPLLGSGLSLMWSVAAQASQTEWMFDADEYVLNGLGFVALGAGAFAALRLPLKGHARFFAVAAAALLLPYVLLRCVEFADGSLRPWLLRAAEPFFES